MMEAVAKSATLPDAQLELPQPEPEPMYILRETPKRRHRITARQIGVVIARLDSRGAVVPPDLSEEAQAWNDFLVGLETAPAGFTPELAKRVRWFWQQLTSAAGALQYPMAEGTDDGGLTLSWSSDQHYAEIEIHRDGRHDWFFRNRQTGSFDGIDDPVTDAPSRAFTSFLSSAFTSR